MSDEEVEVPESPLFGKLYDFLAWLVPLTNHFPRAHRATTTSRLLQAAFNFMERAVDANNARLGARLTALDLANSELDKVRLYFRLAHQWHWINLGQYKYGSQRIGELGRLLGGWQRATRQQLAAKAS